MAQIKTLLWLKWRTLVNAFKTASILAKLLGVIFYPCNLLYLLCLTYLATRQEIDFYITSSILGICILPLFGWQTSSLEQTKDLKRYLVFPLNTHQLLISISLQDIFSIGGLFLIPFLLWFMLCLSTSLVQLVLAFIVLLLYLIFSLLIQNICVFLQRLYRLSNPVFGLIPFLLFFCFAAVLIPESILESFFEKSRSILWLQRCGRTILRFFPSSIFGSMLVEARSKNYINLLIDGTMAVLLLLSSYAILFSLIKRLLRSDPVEIRKGRSLLGSGRFLEEIEDKLGLLKEARGLVYLQIRSLLSPGCDKGSLLLGKYPVALMMCILPSFLSFLFGVDPSPPTSYLFFYGLFLLCVPYMSPFLTNYLGIEGKAVSSFLSFPINRGKFILQQNLIGFLDHILFILFFSLSVTLFIKLPLHWIPSLIIASIPLGGVFLSFGNMVSILFPIRSPRELLVLQRISLLFLAVVGLVILSILSYPIFYLFTILISKYALGYKIISYVMVLAYSLLLYLNTFIICRSRLEGYEKRIIERLKA